MADRRGYITFLIELLLMGGAGVGCGQNLPEGRLLSWRFDELFVTAVGDRRPEPVAVRLQEKVKSIISVSVAGNVAAIVGRESATARASVFLFEWPSGSFESKVQTEAYQAVLGPGGHWLAYTTHARSTEDEDFADLRIRDLRTGKEVVIAQGRASPGTVLTWHPDGRTVTYDSQRTVGKIRNPETDMVTRSVRNRIESVNVETQEITSLFEGSAPAWSPDGKRLAYRRDRTVFVYDTERRESFKVYARGPLAKAFVGGLYWSPAGDFLALNTEVGVMAQGLECLVIEVASGKSRSLGKGTSWCGPWLKS